MDIKAALAKYEAQYATHVRHDPCRGSSKRKSKNDARTNAPVLLVCIVFLSKKVLRRVQSVEAT
jgi:hypothetical protein